MKWIAVWFFFAALLVTADALAQTGGPPSGELAVDLSEPVPPPPVHVRPAVASEADYIDPERAAGNVGLAGPRNEEGRWSTGGRVMFEVGAPITAIGLEFAVWFGGLTGLLQGCSSFGSGSCNAEAEVGFTIASMLLAPVGLAGAVTAAGAAARANGSFGASLLGATLGGLAAFGSVAILAASDEDEGIVVPLGFTLSAALPVIGAVVGYELSVGPAASQAPEVPAFGVAATPDGAFVSLSGAL